MNDLPNDGGRWPSAATLAESMTLLDALALLMLGSLLYYLFASRRPRLALPDIPDSLSRLAFNERTQTLARQRYVTRQLEQARQPTTHANVAQALHNLNTGVLVRRAEFHLRHVVPDSVLRRMVVAVLRTPAPHRFDVIRRLFQALGATDLLIHWDDIRNRLLAHNGDWYPVLGAVRVDRLRNLLTNDINENLFLSESQGNLHAGTHIDITEEAIAILGESRLREISEAVVHALNEMGWRPQIALVGSEFLLSYDGAAGELMRYGYNPIRTHDQHTDPLLLATWGASATVAGHTSFGTLFWYSLRDPRRLLSVCACVIVAAFFLLRWSSWRDQSG